MPVFMAMDGAYTSRKEKCQMPRKMSDYKSIGNFIASMGEWDCTHADLVGKDTLFLEFKTIETQFGEALLVDCYNETDGNISVLVGGQVLMEHLREVEDKLPLRAVIQKHGRYYIFTSGDAEEEPQEPVDLENKDDDIPF